MNTSNNNFNLEKEIRYVCVPDINSKFEEKQARIYCPTCTRWHNLTQKAADALAPGVFNFKTPRYEGYCMRDECNAHIKEDEFWRDFDAKFDV